jgi:cell division septum initiation protein DivIVA
MSENTTATSGLASQYAAQVTGDLERNIKEQERISAEIDALQEQLAALHKDHSVLVNMQQALGVTQPPTESAATSGAPAVPAPRKKAAPDTDNKTRAKKATATPGRTKARKPAAQKVPAPAGNPAQPTLVDLIRGHLTQQSEPRLAAEIATTLGQAHPERRIKTTVVRTTLENLVAKSQAQRSKQGNSVFYSTPDTPGQTSLPQSEAQSDPAE